MRILIAMASLAPSKGGPTAAATQLAAALARLGHQVTLTAHNDGRGAPSEANGPAYQRITFQMQSRVWQYSSEYRRWLRDHAGDFDFVLSNSLFLSHSFWVPLYSRRHTVPYAVRPHGSLTEYDLSRRAFVKRWYLRLIEGRSLREAEFIFCTSQSELDSVRAAGYDNGEVFALGVEPAIFQLDVNPDARSRRSILFLGRLAEKKGLDLLIGSLRFLPGDVHLRIAGPDDQGLGVPLRGMADAMGVGDRVSFLGMLTGAQRYEELRHSGVFALPSADENFGVAVAESLAAGLPVVTTVHVSHAEGIRSAGCGVLTGRTAREVASGLESIMALDALEYKEMCQAARTYANARFDWDSIASELAMRMDSGK